MALLPKAQRKRNPVSEAWNRAVPQHRWSQKASITIRPLLAAHGEAMVVETLLWYQAAAGRGDEVPEIVYPANLVARWAELQRIRRETGDNPEAAGIADFLAEQGWAVQPKSLRRGIAATLANYRAFLCSMERMAAGRHADLVNYLLAHSAPPPQRVVLWYNELNNHFGGEPWCPYMNRWHLAHWKVTREYTGLTQQYMGTGALWEAVKAVVRSESQDL